MANVAGADGENGSAPPIRVLGSSEIRALRAQLGKRPTKRLGQNFVRDPNTIRRVVSAADVRAGECVLEVGPGLGSLTLGLLEVGAVGVAVEIDSVFGAELPATVASHAPHAAARLAVLNAE